MPQPPPPPPPPRPTSNWPSRHANGFHSNSNMQLQSLKHANNEKEMMPHDNVTVNAQYQRLPPPPPMPLPPPQMTSTSMHHADGRPNLPSTPSTGERIISSIPTAPTPPRSLPVAAKAATVSTTPMRVNNKANPFAPPPPPPAQTIQARNSVMQQQQQQKQQTEALIQPQQHIIPTFLPSPFETERVAMHPTSNAQSNRLQYQQNHHQQKNYVPPIPSSLNNRVLQQPLPPPPPSASIGLTTQAQQQIIPLLHTTQHPNSKIPIQQYYSHESSRPTIIPPPPPPHHRLMPPQNTSYSKDPQPPIPPTTAQAVGLQHRFPTQQYHQQQQHPHSQQHLQYPQHWQQHTQNQHHHPIPPPPPPSQYTQPPPQPHLPPPIISSHSTQRDKIDPTQIPRIPLFTRPHHAPATIYPPPTYTSNTINPTTMDTVRQQMALHPLPPPADSRYVVVSCNNSSNSSTDYHHNVLVSPRIMRCTVHTFPNDNATLRKCGDLPLGLVITPLAAMTTLCGGGKRTKNESNISSSSATALPSSSSLPTATTNNAWSSSTQWNGREQGEIYGKSNSIDTTNDVVVDYIPLSSVESTTAATDHEFEEDDFDPERIPVIYDPNRVLTPPRCDRCQAYLNPLCTPVPTTSSSIRFNNNNNNNNNNTQHYNCNICGASSSIAIPEEYIVNGTFDAATRCSTVEYEVGGAYCVRREGPVQNVHLYGVEYVPPSDQNGETSDHQAQHHHHHGNMKSHGWHEAINAIREVARGLSITAAPNANVTIGLFAFYQDMVVFPYLIQSRHQPTRTGEGGSAADGGHELPPCIPHDSDAKMAVAIMSDVMDDPICPLPLHVWTHDIGKGLDSNGWKRFNRILDSFTGVMDQLLSNNPAPSIAADPKRNCGGAALAALADALKDSGGRATLITTRRPNFGVGALADREKYGTPSSRSQHLQQSPYRKASDEQKLFTPLQHLYKSLTNADSIDARAGNFYRQLGEQCAMQRVCIDIVVTSAVVTAPPPPTTASNVGTEAIHPNLREFLDVATLAELCRNTCGKFKWLRVGNECGVAVGDGRRGGGESFTGEQLREELERSALAYAGSDVVFKLRCSSGVQVKSYCPEVPVGTLVGDGIINSAELELSNIHSGTSIAVLLEHKIGGVQDTQGVRRGIDSPMVFFQSAVLYTTLTGRRRVRVSTMGLLTTKVPADVYRSADLGTVAAIMTRQVISDLEDRNEGTINKARSNIFQKCVEVLANYRMHTSARTSPEGQLVLPESLQLLPLFCLSLRKSRLLRNSSIPFKRPFPSADERAYHIFYGRMASPHMSLQCVHPNLFQLSDMRTLDGEWIKPPALETHSFTGENVIAASMHRVCQLPKSMNPSITCLDEKGMYILDDRFAFYLFIGKEVPEEHWRALLSVSTPSGAPRVGDDWVSNIPTGAMGVASTESGRKLRNILHQLRDLNSPNLIHAISARHTYAPLILVFVGRGSVFEEEMDSLLVDDPDDHEKSYVDFLCDVHKALRQKVNNE